MLNLFILRIYGHVKDRENFSAEFKVGGACTANKHSMKSSSHLFSILWHLSGIDHCVVVILTDRKISSSKSEFDASLLVDRLDLKPFLDHIRNGI